MTGFFDIEDANAQQRNRRLAPEVTIRADAQLALRALDEAMSVLADKAENASRRGLRSMADCFHVAKADVYLIRRRYERRGGAA